jgi:hypothetical protein
LGVPGTGIPDGKDLSIVKCKPFNFHPPNFLSSFVNCKLLVRDAKSPVISSNDLNNHRVIRSRRNSLIEFAKFFAKSYGYGQMDNDTVWRQSRTHGHFLATTSHLRLPKTNHELIQPNPRAISISLPNPRSFTHSSEIQTTQIHNKAILQDFLSPNSTLRSLPPDFQCHQVSHLNYLSATPLIKSLVVFKFRAFKGGP